MVSVFGTRSFSSFLVPSSYDHSSSAWHACTTLFVLAAPVTLLLRTLPVPAARVVTRLFRSWFGHLVTHPVSTTLLNVE